MDEDGRHDVGARLGQLVALRLPRLLQVQRVGGHSGPGRLDLAPKVLGLVDVELLAVGHVAEDVLLEADNLVLALLLVIVISGARGGHIVRLEVVRGRVREKSGGPVEAALDGGANGGEDGLGGEEVDAAVDEVADVGLGLLDVVEDAAGVGIGDDAAKVGGGVVAHASAEDDGLGVALNGKLEHLGEGEGAADVGVEDEEAVGPALEDGVAEVVQAAGGAEGLILSQVADGDGGELLGRVLDEVAEDGLVVVADDVHLLNDGDAGDGRQAVPDDGVAGHLEQRLGDVEREGAEARAARRAADLRQTVVSSRALAMLTMSPPRQAAKG